MSRFNTAVLDGAQIFDAAYGYDFVFPSQPYFVQMFVVGQDEPVAEHSFRTGGELVDYCRANGVVLTERHTEEALFDLPFDGEVEKPVSPAMRDFRTMLARFLANDESVIGL